ncbi:MAG: ABC transporter permease [Cyclobacteriaceae bacterium]|nr:ABC transporter permease [Cyclobacteriaceae bacterium]
MKQLITFILKEFRHIFRDVRTLVILFGMPVVQVTLFGYAITNEVKDADIVVLDKSHDYLSTRLTNKITSSGYFYLKDKAATVKEVDKLFREDAVKLAIIIPEHFAERVQEKDAHIQLLADASDPNQANILVNYTNGIINKFMFEEAGVGLPYAINTEVEMTYNPTLEGVFLFVPGVITIILMLVSALLTSIAITREKELGTMEILLVSPLKPIQIILGKVIPYMLLSFMNAMFILLMGVFIFHMPINGSIPLLLGESLLFIITALSLGILISTKAASQQVAMMVSLFALMLPTILLSGFIFPISSMPWPLQWLSMIMPPKYFIIILKGIMLQGVGLAVLWKETLVLTGMTLVFLAAGIKNFKIRLA